MKPYLNLDFSECYLGKCVGLFIGDFCLAGLRFTSRSRYLNFGVVIFNLGAGVYRD